MLADGEFWILQLFSGVLMDDAGRWMVLLLLWDVVSSWRSGHSCFSCFLFHADANCPSDDTYYSLRFQCGNCWIQEHQLHSLGCGWSGQSLLLAPAIVCSMITCCQSAASMINVRKKLKLVFGKILFRTRLGLFGATTSRTPRDLSLSLTAMTGAAWFQLVEILEWFI